ncbi:uncharacterized protein LOC128897832 [Dryobates pubescens]|uniref:uncharacterized protein LOC128897832 n=1 Tax=Dryobates pubescens TaxID=118200 RepID=UPI0023B8D501|nr:uncharacterized protein LOC128897832 [Dryobates pubescens]
MRVQITKGKKERGKKKKKETGEGDREQWGRRGSPRRAWPPPAPRQAGGGGGGRRGGGSGEGAARGVPPARQGYLRPTPTSCRRLLPPAPPRTRAALRGGKPANAVSTRATRGGAVKATRRDLSLGSARAMHSEPNCSKKSKFGYYSSPRGKPYLLQIFDTGTSPIINKNNQTNSLPSWGFKKSSSGIHEHYNSFLPTPTPLIFPLAWIRYCV